VWEPKQEKNDGWLEIRERMEGRRMPMVWTDAVLNSVIATLLKINK